MLLIVPQPDLPVRCILRQAGDSGSIKQFSIATRMARRYHGLTVNLTQQGGPLSSEKPLAGSIRAVLLRQAVLPLIIFAGAAIRLFQIGRESLWYDELYTVWASRLPLDVMYREVPASGHPLLYYLIAHIWYQLGSGDAWFRTISWAAGVATILLAYLLGKELFSRTVGLWVAAFAAFSPFLIWYSRDATDYSLLVALATLSEYFLVRSVMRRGWANWAAYAVATTAALYVHYYAFILLFAEVILFLFISDRRRSQIRPWALSLGAIAAMLLPYTLLGRGSESWAVFSWPSWGVMKAVIVAPTIFAKGYVNSIGSGAAAISPRWWSVAGMALGIIMVLVLIISSGPLRRNLYGKKGLGLAVCAATVIAGPALVRSQFMAGRDINLGAVPFMLLVALALAALPRKSQAVAGGAIIAGLIGFATVQFFYSHNDDWRGTMGTIEARAQPGDEILCIPLHDCVVAQAIYQNDLPIDGGEIRSWDNSDVVLQQPPGWVGYSSEVEHSDYKGQDLVDELEKRFSGAGGVWMLVGVRINGQSVVPDGIESGLSAAGWTVQQDDSTATIDLKRYVRK